MYKEKYAEELKTYEELLTKYRSAIETDEFFNKRNSIPFEILPALHKCEEFAMYHKLSVDMPHPHMIFYSTDEASVFYKSMINTYRNVERLLENAAYLNDIYNIGIKINSLVENSAYLTEGFKVAIDKDITTIVRNTLKRLPEYKKLMTKGLKYDFIESAISCLDIEGIKRLVKENIIIPTDLDNIHLSMPEVKGYDEKIRELCTILGHTEPLIEKHEMKVVGVTFKNEEDGSSRQDIIKEMTTAMASGQKILLKAEPYTFYPEVGEGEPAIRIKWGEKTIGNIEKTAVKEMYEKYKNPQYTVELLEVTGGNGVSFGVKINLGVVAPEYSKKTIEENNEKNGFTHDIEKEQEK